MYVVGCDSNNVLVFSPDGQHHRQLLSGKHDIVNPTVLDYDKSTKKLLVASKSTSAFLFDAKVGQYMN